MSAVKGAIYDPFTGLIDRTVAARTAGLVAQQVQPGETWCLVSEAVEADTHKIEDGVAVPLNP